jgi:diadenosine tetraphosphate (Ap4A) HIT family hydrolase
MKAKSDKFPFSIRRGPPQRRLRVEAFDIGLNDERAASQTVMHADIHVVPRRVGDVSDLLPTP